MRSKKTWARCGASDACLRGQKLIRRENNTGSIVVLHRLSRSNAKAGLLGQETYRLVRKMESVSTQRGSWTKARAVKVASRLRRQCQQDAAAEWTGRPGKRKVPGFRAQPEGLCTQRTGNGEKMTSKCWQV